MDTGEGKATNKVMTTSDQADMMPTTLREIHDGLSTEFNWICAKFKVYKQLFEPDTDTTKLLNAKVRDLSVIIENSLADDILVSVCRITDGLKSVGHECLVLEQLAENIDGCSPDETILKEHVRKESIDIRDYCEDFRQWRNNRIAHANLAISLNRPVAPLPTVHIKKIEEALRRISHLMNSVEGHFNSMEIRYEDIILRGDGRDLVFFLRKADEYEERERKELYELYSKKE
ncbi:MAG: hypothetical protein M1434_09730 [Chloroflexi bacterium]|nr:hypothetical protein [Chloroflexota bacterium]